MRNAILSLSMGLLLLAGCSKEESVNLNEVQGSESEYVHLFNGDQLVWETISAEEMKRAHSNSGVAISAANRGNSVHAHGDFHGLGGTISFSGTQNNGGVHGSAEIEVSSGPGPGGPGGTAHIILATTSVTVITIEGEDAVVYGGIVTEVIENTIASPPGDCLFYGLGTYIYILVKDNGQGVNAPVDQYRSVLVRSCDELPEGGAAYPWDFFIFSWGDVEGASDKIKVNY